MKSLRNPKPWTLSPNARFSWLALGSMYSLGFRLGFRVWGLGFGVWGLGFRVWGLGFRVWGLGFRVSLHPKGVQLRTDKTCVFFRRILLASLGFEALWFRDVRSQGVRDGRLDPKISQNGHRHGLGFRV